VPNCPAMREITEKEKNGYSRIAVASTVMSHVC